MYQAYSNTKTTYEQNAPLSFPTVKYTDCRINVSNGTTIRIGTPGRYLVSFNGVGGSTGATTPFTVQLYKDGVAQPETVSTVTSVAANDVGTLAFTTIVNILPSCNCVNNAVNLQVIATNATSGFLNEANIVIYRIR